jgi:hypothetical protein
MENFECEVLGGFVGLLHDLGSDTAGLDTFIGQLLYMMG